MNKEPRLFESLISDVDRTSRREKISKKTITDNIKNIVNLLDNTIQEIKNDIAIEEEGSNKLRLKLHNMSQKALGMKPMENILKTHKDYYAYISKLGKEIDKNLKKEQADIFQAKKLDKQMINNVISDHLLRDGKFEAYQTFGKEAILSEELDEENLFKDLHEVLSQCKNQNIEPAIEWALNHREDLDELDSDLLMNLYQQKFLTILKSEGQPGAIQFAREHFQGMFPKYASDIQKLMGSLIFNEPTDNPRYTELYDPGKWEQLAADLAFQACKIYKTTPKSALTLVHNAGVLMLPKFIKYYSLQAKNDLKWERNEEIPIPNELGKEFQFHSVFVCPVTKEVTTPENPPMMLKCGHVISEQSLKKLKTSHRARFKCPYCPVEQSQSQAKKIQFDSEKHQTTRKEQRAKRKKKPFKVIREAKEATITNNNAAEEAGAQESSAI